MMRSLILSLALIVTAFSTSAQAEDAKLVRAVVAVDADTKPATTFAATTPELVVFFLGDGVKKDDKLRAVWIADDVGDAAPKNTTIVESALTAEADKFNGAFKLSKPDNGWPVGKYHVDIYVGDKLAETVKFEIEAAK